MEDKITFIIPSINRPSLKDSIESLLNQTNSNWECIVIYDGVDGPNFNDNRIKTIKIKKIGVSDKKNIHGESGLVRNYGIKNCKTKWIGFLDDDDTLTENYVQDLFEKYNNYDFVVFRMKKSNGDIIPPLDCNEILMYKVGISFCYKNIFKNLFFDSNQQTEDFYFLNDLLNLTNNFIITKDVYYKAKRISKLPKDFDWKFYLHNYPDLMEAGLQTEEDVKTHYLDHGQFENRIYKNSLKEYQKQEINKIPYTVGVLDKGKTVVFSPHPDDEIFGCGGALIEHIKQKDEVNVYVVTDGGHNKHSNYVEKRKKESINSKNIIGYNLLTFLNYQDRNIDYYKLEKDIVNILEKENPKIVYVPHINELHPDHVIVNKLVKNILNNKKNNITIMNYEISYPLFQVNFLLEITDVNTLCKAFDCFKSQLEMQNYKEQLISLKKYRTYTLKNVDYAEAFYKEII